MSPAIIATGEAAGEAHMRQSVAKRAREALADCTNALIDFERAANTEFQRPRWVAVMTLLRTVGLVLKAVDYPLADPETRQRIDGAWKDLNAAKPEPRIFHEFIDAERFQAVHLYEVRAQVNVTVRPGPAILSWSPVVAGATSGMGGGPTTFDFIMREGPFKGHDPLDLCGEAIAFWRTYLDAIDGVGDVPGD
jgi:hypothetical protein